MSSARRHPSSRPCSRPCSRWHTGLTSRCAAGISLALALAAPAARSQAAPDNLVPAAIDAALATPDDPVEFGIPDHAPGIVIASVQPTPSSRCALSVGDVTGDGADDFATGYAPAGHSRDGATTPRGVTRTLVVRDGRTAAVLWSAAPGGGGFRGLRTLAFADGSLLAAASSDRGRVERLHPATGAVLWATDLAPAGGPPVNLLALEPLADVNRDGATDVAVAGGRGVDGVVLLSGADGAVLWTHAAGDAASDVRAAADADADGVPDLLCCGGDVTPFARLLSGATGAVLWSAGLSGPGSAVLPLPDISGDGRPDVAAGSFSAPAPCVVALDGASGAPLWTSDYAVDDVTALAGVGDVNGDGRADFVVAGFDNALTAVMSDSGIFQWRTEGSLVNGGSMLGVANVGDLDGNGAQDLVTSSLDRHVYLVDGRKGYFLSVQDLRSRGVALAALDDADGDGRREFAACGSGSLLVLDGTSGIADGPLCYLAPPPALSSEYVVYSYAYPGFPLLVLGAPGTGRLVLPGYTGAFGLSLQSFQVVVLAQAPGAGLSGYVLPPLPREAIGLTLHFQTVSLFAPGKGAFSNVASFTVTR
jgi:hypothetical protein